MHGQTDEDRIFQQMVSAFDTPAYIRRAKTVEAAWEQLLERCRRQREEWLKFPKLRLAMVFALVGNGEALHEYFGSSDADALAALRDEWQSRLRIPVSPAQSPQEVQRALHQLQSAFERFNARWEKFVHELDLTDINRLRDGYNRFYVLEKECAVRSAKVARAGFQPMPIVTARDLQDAFPALPAVRLK